MDLNEYQNLAQRTSGSGHDRVKNGCMGLIGESGEIVDIMKKYMFQSKPDTPLPVDKLIDEMGDVMWYIAEPVTGMEFSLKYVLATSGGRRFHKSITTDQYAVTLVSAAIEVYANCLAIYQERSALATLCFLYDLLCAMCASIGTTIDHVMERNIEKLRKRYLPTAPRPAALTSCGKKSAASFTSALIRSTQS